jgi:hypothetical protein
MLVSRSLEEELVAVCHPEHRPAGAGCDQFPPLPPSTFQVGVEKRTARPTHNLDAAFISRAPTMVVLEGHYQILPAVRFPDGGCFCRS